MLKPKKTPNFFGVLHKKKMLSTIANSVPQFLFATKGQASNRFTYKTYNQNNKCHNFQSAIQSDIAVPLCHSDKKKWFQFQFHLITINLNRTKPHQQHRFTFPSFLLCVVIISMTLFGIIIPTCLTISLCQRIIIVPKHIANIFICYTI